MRFLVDECTGPIVARWLAERGHHVFSVYDQARGLPDDAILEKANAEAWIVVTNDKDFGEMVHRDRRQHRGVVFLRLQNERAMIKIAAMEKLLNLYSGRLEDAFVVVTESQVRFGRASLSS